VKGEFKKLFRENAKSVFEAVPEVERLEFWGTTSLTEFRALIEANPNLFRFVKLS